MTFKMRTMKSFYSICLSGAFLFCLIAAIGTIGCGGGGGGGGGAQGYQIEGHAVEGEAPWYVNLTFSVTDAADRPVTSLTKSNFVIQEDDNPPFSIDTSTDIILRQRSSLPYIINTVIVLDNSPSQTPYLETIKDAAKAIVGNMDEEQQQKVAIVVFDNAGDVSVLHPLSSDGNSLTTAIDTIQSSDANTNLYGSIMTGLDLFTDEISPLAETIQQGALIAVTDGIESVEIWDLDTVIASRDAYDKPKPIYTVAVDSDEIDSDVITELKLLGNAGYYAVPNPVTDEQSTDVNLEYIMRTIQADIIAHADSFYQIRYQSPTTSSDVPTDHDLNLTIKNNGNTDKTTAEYSDDFSSAAFVSNANGVYLNAVTSDPDGINGINSANPDTVELCFDPPYNDANPIPAFDIQATTRGGNKVAQYRWVSEADNIVSIEVDEKVSSKAKLIPQGIRTIPINISVVDTINHFQIEISVVVAKGGVLLNADVNDLDGLNGLDDDEPDTIDLAWDPINDPDEETYDIMAATFGENSKSPVYNWTSSDEDVITVAEDTADPTKAVIKAQSRGTATLTVTDTENDQEIKIFVNVGSVIGSYMFEPHLIEPLYPWYVGATFHVQDIYSEFAPELTPTNFVLEETDNNHDPVLIIDDQYLDEENPKHKNPAEVEMNFRKHDHHIFNDHYTYTLKTVLLIDRTPSIEVLQEIRDAAKAMVDAAFTTAPLLNGQGDSQQQIAVYTFSEDNVDMVHDFSSNAATLKALIDTIDPSYTSSTDLYGATIEALSLWDNDYAPYADVDDDKVIQEGVIILVTDGHQTSDFHTLDEIIDARDAAYKQIAAIGVGDAIASSDLKDIGNLFYQLSPNSTDIESAFLTAQEKLIDYANSFYWLEYKSLPPAGVASTDFALKISIKDNKNNDLDQHPVMEGDFSKADFFSGEPGVYINATAADPEGIDFDQIDPETGEGEKVVLDLNGDPSGLWEDSLQSQSSVDLAAFTYDGFAWYLNSEYTYTWAINPENSIVVLTGGDDDDSSTATISLPNNKQIGDTWARVTSINNENTFSKVVNISVEERNLPQPVLFYPFNGNADDESGNGYDGEVFNGATLIADRFGNLNSAYLFDGDDDYIAIKDLHYGPGAGAYADEINEIAICGWVKTSSPEEQMVAAFGGDYWVIEYHYGNRTDKPQELRLLSYPLGVRVGDVRGKNIDNKWHFFCACFKSGGAGQLGSLDFYVDGELVQSESLAADKIMGGTDITRYGFVGTESTASTYNGDQTNGDPPDPRNFDGAIDDFIIFDKALTEEQVKQLYHINGWEN